MKNEGDIHGIRINALILEDSEADLQLVENFLIEAGYDLSCTHAVTEEDFTSALRTQNYDIIISDFKLPGFNAFAALDICSHLSPDTPLICLSGSMGEETAIDLLKFGAVDYVLKDRMQRLPFAVKRALEKSREIEIRKRAEQQIKESEEKFRNLFDNHAAVKLIIDPDNGKIVEANKAAAEFYGYSKTALEEMTISEINIFPVSTTKTEIKKAREQNKSHFNFKHRKADRSIVDVEVFSSHITIKGKEYLHSIVHDVTEKKKAESQLRKLSQAVEQSPASVIITDLEGHIQYVNPKFLSVTGYSYHEVINQNPRILKSGEQPDDYYKELWKTITSGEVWRGELKNRKKNGELYWESASISPIKNDHGIISHFLAVKEDITERKKAEEMILKNLEEKNVLLSEIHHRVKNNMAIITSLLELQTGFENGDQHPEILIQDLQSRIKSMGLVHELVYQSKNFSEINTRDLIQRLVTDLQNIYKPADKEITVDLECDDILLDINTSIPFTLLINESLTNSYKHAFSDQESGSIAITFRKEGDAHRLVIQDNGKGVPDLDRLNHPSSFGYTIIHGLAKQIRCKLAFSGPDTGGLRVDATFPC